MIKDGLYYIAYKKNIKNKRFSKTKQGPRIKCGNKVIIYPYLLSSFMSQTRALFYSGIILICSSSFLSGLENNVTTQKL